MSATSFDVATAVPMLRARDRRSSHTRCGSRRTPSTPRMSTRATSSTWPRLALAARASGQSTLSGHPPRQMSSASSPRGTSCRPAPGGSPASMRVNEMAPDDRPASCSDIGRRRRRTMRRIPVCRVASSAGMADPVRMNWPVARRSSTARRTWFQIPGQVSSVLVDVEQDFAVGELPRAGGLTATTNPLDHHAAGGAEELPHLQIGDPGEVACHWWSSAAGGHRDARRIP